MRRFASSAAVAMPFASYMRATREATTFTESSSCARADGAARSTIRRNTAHCFGLQAGRPARPGQPRAWRHWLVSSE